MSLLNIDGLQSEVFVPITPKPVFAKVTKPLKDMKIAIVTAAGVHMKKDKPFNLAGDTSYRVVPSSATDDELMVSHGGYDNTDVNKDINCMFPIDRLRELADEGFIGSLAPSTLVWVVVETLKSSLKKLVQQLLKRLRKKTSMALF